MTMTGMGDGITGGMDAMTVTGADGIAGTTIMTATGTEDITGGHGKADRPWGYRVPGSCFLRGSQTGVSLCGRCLNSRTASAVTSKRRSTWGTGVGSALPASKPSSMATSLISADSPIT